MFVNKIAFWLLLMGVWTIGDVAKAGVQPEFKRYQISEKEIITFLQVHSFNLNSEWRELSLHRMTSKLFTRNMEEAFNRANLTNKHLNDQSQTLYEFLESYFGPSTDYLSQEGYEEFLDFQNENIATGLKELENNKKSGIWKSNTKLHQAVVKNIQEKICHHLTTHEYYEGVPPFLLVVENLSGDDGRHLCNVHLIGLADTSLCGDCECGSLINSCFSGIASLGELLCSFGAIGVP